ncbi:ATP-binding cassette domain-containing protein [Leptothrix ochracea]|uniref:ATP-binding cassette domain-containing protein n=1 Tax=Leptothrix ochracea TaxID=735331 RepID=UPI0034E23892
MNPRPLIALHALSYVWPGNATEIRFPDLSVERGSVLVLRAASGRGKSTLLALLAGLLSPSAGQIHVDGVVVSALTGAARDRWRGRHVGFLPQRLHWVDALSVERNVALALWAAGLPPDEVRVRALLAALGLTEFAQRRPHQLSGGQAQRAALARALVTQPSLLLVDEPTASLDDAAAAAALSALDQASTRYGATLLIATHDARVGAAFGARAREIQL